jgi:biopolymer transport protein TolR
MTALTSGFVKKQRNPSQEIVRPQLTSIIDMMVFLLIFILKTFSTEGNIITPSADLLLPYSASKDKAGSALMIEITKQAVLVDGEPVVTLAQMEESDSLLIRPLFQHLEKRVKILGGEKKERPAIIQCDKNIDFKYLKRVLNTCARASYSDFSLLVLQKE